MLDMKTYMANQIKEALGDTNRWYCSQCYGYQVTDPDVLLAYYIKHGGATFYADQNRKTEEKEKTEAP